MDDTFRDELHNRRERIRAFLKQPEAKSDVLVLFSAPVYLRNGDVEHTYRQHSDFYYLSGLEEPESALVITADEPGYVLFVRERDRERETWEGRRAGTEGALAIYGADQAFCIDEFSSKIADLLEDRQRVHFLFGEQQAWDSAVLDAVAAVRTRRRKRVDPPSELVDARSILHEARLRKSTFEQQRLADVAELSARAHLQAMMRCQPGMREWELQDVVENEFRRRGSRRVAYDSIVGSGENATILHYRENESVMQPGDLVLIDAGAELDYLAADITRTFPVSGSFSDVQAKLYQLVLDAQVVAIEECRVGRTMDDVHEAAAKVIGEGLLELGLMSESDASDAALRKKRISHFFMHKTSHYIGMDVHDVGRYFEGGKLRTLEAGMVITVEPGLYIAADDESSPAEFRGIGIRIEDDILITEGGPSNLTSLVPKTIKEVEAACQGVEEN